MVRSRDNNSARPRFFIVHKDSTCLEGQYAYVGYVTEGRDIVDDVIETIEVVD